MNNRMTLRAGTYKQTKLHKQHVSDVIKKWWAVPTNKERMSKIQTGIDRRNWSEESKKRLSESMNLQYEEH
jgi:hypothetical protein